MVVFVERYVRHFVIRFLMSDWYTVSYSRYDRMCYKMHATLKKKKEVDGTPKKGSAEK